MKKLVILMSLVLGSTSIFADQCLVISRDQAAKAIFELFEAKSIQAFCEPCGDTAPSDSVTLKTISVTKSVANDVEVLLNGEAIDLAYTYVDGVNLASLSNCPTVGVSQEIN